ncbi:hypothetical protein GCM10023321_70530 [Pseudonocardia eucalypti]|uniref:Tetratricopeptide repeat protein n=1 Tax=Pseudonocardia eucalypti TaxID=648755 RepID=A0ABP9R4Y2_9PSEU|nr:tetratricopeptide (TPR) repeat protein [Pseudonocardia eucalypti]
MLEVRAGRRFTVGLAALNRDLGRAGDGSDGGAPPDEWAGSAADLARAARLKQTLAMEQARAGRLADACRTVEGVVRVYRRLAETSPERFRPELAHARSAWGLWASRRGETAASAEALAEAVELYRQMLASAGRLRAMHRIRLSVGLAVALTNLGVVRSELGDHLAAGDAAEESVRILRRLHARNPLYRLLARQDPTGFAHCLAASVSNLGVVCAERGRLGQACELAEETVAIFRQLAAIAPVVYESMLARALHNLGLASAQVGRLDTALAATQEAVYLYRCLVPADPKGHRHDLARALCAFARVRVACQHELAEALAAAEEAVLLLEELTAGCPQAFSGDLHASYRTAGLVRRALEELD